MRETNVPPPKHALERRGAGGYRRAVIVIRQILARRHLTTLILACALAVRVLVPAGFMIGHTASGAPALVLCPGQNDLPPAMPGTHHDMAHMMPDGSMMSGHDTGQKHQDPGTDRPCAFAAVGLAVDMPIPAPLLAPAPPPAFAALLSQTPSIPGRGLAAPPPPSTGPPAFA
jgi:hypothetical protein